jgi:carboxymethylenebutenolidase
MDPGERSKPIDPTQASSAALNRRAFVGLGAGAAVAGSITAALAAGEGFGAPHPPIVAEDDGAIEVTRPTLQSDGRAVDAYAAKPRGTVKGGIVVVQAIWGVDAQLRDVVRRFAKEGYVAVAPDLYAGLGAPSGDGSSDVKPFSEVAAKLADATVDADLRAAAQWAENATPHGGDPSRHKVGVTGFCMGGGITLRQAVDNADVFAAAVMWYGKVRYSTNPNNNGPITRIALAYSDNVRAPLLGNFGGRDTSILPADVRALNDRLTIAHDLKIYDEAGHAFFDDTRPSYVASAAADGWTRALAWFERYIA